MRCYEDGAVRDAIARLLKPEWKPNELMEPETWTRVDAFFALVCTIETTAYGAGMREVQQGIIKSLDLNHLLGLHAR